MMNVDNIIEWLPQMADDCRRCPLGRSNTQMPNTKTIDGRMRDQPSRNQKNSYTLSPQSIVSTSIRLGPKSKPTSFAFSLLLTYFLIVISISSVCTFTETELEQISSALSSQSNLASVSTVDSSSPSSASSSGNTLTLRSNLSCYVCTTIDDMRCKFINETNKHLFELEDDSNSRSSHSLRNRRPDMQSILTSYSGNNRDGSIIPNSNEILDSDQDSSNEQSIPTSPEHAHRIFGTECLPTEQYCLVRRLGVSPINSNSHEFNFFALQRSCASHCTPGCFIIGERTKLSFCTACCTDSYCNVGNGAISDWRTLSSCWRHNVAIIIAITILLFR